MEPVISPWAIYFIGLCDKLFILFAIVAAISGALAFWFGLAVILNEAPDLFKPLVKKLFTITIVFSLIAVLIPSKQTGIAMLASSYITPDNIVGTEEHIVEFVKKIAEAVK